jgi:hypothetical protein
MNNRFFRFVSLTALLAFGAMAHAQVPVGPFGPSAPAVNNFENFDAIAPGAYVSFPMMGGAAACARVSTGGLLAVDNALLPGFSLPNSMWGRGTAVEMRFSTTKRFFGGFFRVPNAGIATNAVIVQFYQANVQVGVAVAPVNNVGWLWRGWYLGIGFNRLIISGNNASGGYIGMDNIRVRN